MSKNATFLGSGTFLNGKKHCLLRNETLQRKARGICRNLVSWLYGSCVSSRYSWNSSVTSLVLMTKYPSIHEDVGGTWSSDVNMKRRLCFYCL